MALSMPLVPGDLASAWRLERRFPFKRPGTALSIHPLQLPDNLEPSRLIRAMRGLLDFIYLSQLPIQTLCTLNRLDTALHVFHSNKSIFVDLGIREHFNIPKLHSCIHYASSIRFYGTTDNYNTQFTERLHIDLAKDAYRATNKKDELSQMTTWLERCEKIQQHDNYIRWRLSSRGCSSLPTTPQSSLIPERRIKMTCRPTIYAVSINTLASDYGATYFRDAFARYVVGLQNPGFNRRQVERESLNVNIPFINVSVYHRIKFVNAGGNEIVDALHVQPRKKTVAGQGHSERFDTALVRTDNPSGRGGTKQIHGT
jgi:hypothetical protein